LSQTRFIPKVREPYFNISLSLTFFIVSGVPDVIVPPPGACQSRRFCADADNGYATVNATIE
jgi:hypothetical protein